MGEVQGITESRMLETFKAELARLRRLRLNKDSLHWNNGVSIRIYVTDTPEELLRRYTIAFLKG